MTDRNPAGRGFVPAALIILLILAFSGILLREGRLRDMDLARLGSLEAATAVAEAFGAGEEPSPEEAAVIGWGIYSPEGTALAARGSAPDRLEAPPSGPGVSENLTGSRLRSVRTMVAARPSEVGSHGKGAGSGGGGGAGMRRLVLIDWDMQAEGNTEILRLGGIAGLVILTVLMLILQQKTARRLALFRRDEERRRRLMQLGLAARTLTHEIRNPLGTIRAQSALLRRTFPRDTTDGLNTIDAEVDRLNSLTVRVQEWLADPRGRPETFDAGERIHQLLDNGELSLYVDAAMPGPMIYMDAGLFDSTLLNLARNAVESQEDIPEAPPPRICLTTTGRVVRIDVEDRGQGLPKDGRESIFDPFFTTKNRGSGVGLSLALQAVEAAGGELALENRRDGGTRARMTLPLEKH